MTTITVWLLFLAVSSGMAQAEAKYPTQAECERVAQLVQRKGYAQNVCVQATIIKP